MQKSPHPSEPSVSRRGFLGTSAATALSLSSLSSVLGTRAYAAGSEEIKVGLSPPPYAFGDLPVRPIPVPGKTKLT